MTLDNSQFSRAAELQDTQGRQCFVKRGRLVEYLEKRGARGFQWTEAGRHGAAVLRRCVYLQHATRVLQAAGSTPCGGAHGNSAARSGAADCISLVQAQADGGEGCLARVASCFLEAVWAELRHTALGELQGYASVMRPLEEAFATECGVVGTGAVADLVSAALAHIWSRCRVWRALHRAPTELLGDLNEALTGAWAPEALLNLRRAVQLLLDCWQAGLAQMGQQLQLTLRRSDSGPLSGEASAKWLLAWRLYLDTHRQLEAFVRAHGLQLHLPDPSALVKPHAQHMDQAGPAARVGAHAAASSASGALQGSADGSVRRQMQSGPVLHPLTLLGHLTSAWAAKAAETVRTRVQNTEQPTNLASSSRANQTVLDLNRSLALLVQQLISQLQDVLDPDDPTAAAAGAGQQGKQTLPGSMLLESERLLRATAGSLGPVINPPSTLMTTGKAEPPNAHSSHAGGDDQPQLLTPSVRPGPAPSSAGSSCDSGATPLLDLVELLAPLLPRRRLNRFREQPGLLVLQQFLRAATKLAPVGSQLGAADTTAAGGCTSNEMLKYGRAAALAHGVCMALHQTHIQLVGLQCASRVSGPPEQPLAFRPLQDPEVAGAEDLVPVLAITQLPVDAPNQRVITAATAAGAVSLATTGATAHDLRTAAAHVAAARAGVLARMARSAAGGAPRAIGGATQVPRAPWPLAREVPAEDLDEDAVAVVTRAMAWARRMEAQAKELTCTGEAEADPAVPVPASTGAATVAVGPPADAPCDVQAVLRAALLIAAGRLCLLAATAGCGAKPHGPVFRWGPCDAGAQTAWKEASLMALLLTPDAGLGEQGEGEGQSSTPSGLWRFSTPDTRRATLGVALAACAAATNRVAHVPKMHCPGPGADLKALCVAHSDAVTLGSAVEDLLAVVQALALHAWGQSGPLGRSRLRTGCGSRPLAPDSAASGGCTASGGCSSAGRAVLKSTTPFTQPAQAEAGVGGHDGGIGPHRRKRNWRRSFRRIMPYLGSERASSKVMDLGSSSAAAGGAASDVEQPLVGPGPPAKQGYWATDPVESVRAVLPPPAPLCSIPPQAMGETQPGGGTVRRGARPGVRDTAVLSPHDGSRQVQSSCAQAADSASGALALSAASLALLRGASQSGWRERALGGDAAVALGHSVAEAAVLLMLQSACSELRATATRAAELLAGEMSSRIAAAYRVERTGEPAAAQKGRVGAGRTAGASATQEVVAILLRPLREALEELHPASQAQLLCASYSSVLLVLRHAVRATVGSPGAGGAAGVGRRGGGRPEQTERARRLDEDIAALQDEVKAAWDQVDRGAATRGLVVGAGFLGAKEGGLDTAVGGQKGFVMARSDIGIQIRTLRAELGVYAAAPT